MISPLDSALAIVNAEPVYELRQATVRAMLVAYHERWKFEDRKYRINRVEQVITAPLLNPNTRAKSRTYEMGGMIDVDVIDESGQHGIIDHKTTSDDIEDAGGAYWQQLIVESQLDHYLLAKHINGERSNFAVWDVMRKPGIRPRELKKAEIGELGTYKTYFGSPVASPEHIEAALASGRETLALYENRLLSECMGNPKRYFQRRSIVRTDGEILVYAEDLWDNAQDMITARRTERRPRHSGSCMNYGRPCKYLGICSSHDTPESEKWIRKEHVHVELPVINDGQGGRSLLTNSRVRMFQACRRKEYYHYDLGLDTAEPEEVETLNFGTLWHKCLAAYFEAIKEKQNGNSANATPAALCA